MNNITEFSRRIGISLNAGISVMTALKREAARFTAGTRWRRIIESLAASIENGTSLSEAIAPFKNDFGEMFCALIEVGEESGRLGETFIELADYFDQMAQLRRNFFSALIWPAIELGLAILVIGILILALGVVEQLTGMKLDILGMGLVGVTGFIKYSIFVLFCAATSAILYRVITKDIVRFGFVHHFLAKIPVVGSLLMTLALMKLTWGLHLTMRTGMDIRRALRLSFGMVGFAPVTEKLPMILHEIDSGESFAEAFSESFRSVFTNRCSEVDQLLASIDTGEVSGTIPEEMQRLTKVFLNESLMKIRVLSVVGGFIVYGLVAICIIFMIFKIASFYLGILDGAIKMTI